jgi:hypothetical protein
MVSRLSVLIIFGVVLFGCSPDQKGIKYSDPVHMRWLSAKMQEAHIPFKLGTDGVLWYAPQYADQVKKITDELTDERNKPYVEETFLSQEYKQLLLSQLAAAGRKYEFVPGSGENTIRWWPEAPGELEQMQERIAKAWAASHSSPDLPCPEQPKPSNFRCSGRAEARR